jgi:NAD(P)-dependent dehydrogenase (short-subunit alcohol dehydrogenase family)
MYTVLMATDLAPENIKVNVVNPGYTATNLNHNSGFQTVAEGAVEIVRLAQLSPDAPTCSYTEARDGKTGIPIAW